MIEQLFRRVQMMIGIGRTQTAPKDDGPIQTVQVRLQPDNAVRDDSKVLQLYGFSSSMPVGSDVVMVFLAGDRANGLIVGTANQAARRRNLAEGEVSVHALGMEVHLSQSGIVINAGGKPLTVTNGSKARFEMPIESTGEVTAMVDGNSVGLSSHLTTRVLSGGGTSGPPQPHS